MARGIRVGNERVWRMMKEHDIKATGKKALVVTTDSKHNLPIASLLSPSTYASTLQVVP